MEAGIRNPQFRMPAFSFLGNLAARVRTSSTAGALLEIVLPVLPLFFLYFLQPGVPAAIDMPLHLRAANDYALVLLTTGGIPDWDPFVFNGFGALTFRYSGQSPLFVSSLFILSGCTPGMALKLSVLAFAIAGSWGMRGFLGAEGLSRPRRIVGSLLLFSGPGVAMHLYHNFFFQHLCAVLLFPCVLAAMKTSSRRLAIAIGAMCWTHLQMTFVCICLASFVSVVRSVMARSARQFVAFLAAASVGGCLAAPFLLPAMLSVKEAHFEGKNKVRPGIESLFIDEVFRSDTDVNGNKDLVEIGRFQGLRPALGYLLGSGVRIHSEDGLVLFRFLRSWMFLAVVIVLGLAIAGWLLAWRRDALPCSLVGFLACLAMFRCSMPLWQLVSPVGELLEFSWRLLIPAQILLAPAMTDGGFACARTAGRRLPGVAVPILFLLLFGGLPAISAVFAGISKPFGPSDIEYYMNEGRAVAPSFKPFHAPLAAAGRSDGNSLFFPSIVRGAGAMEPGEPWLAGTRFRVDVASCGARIRIAAHYDRDWRLTAAGRDITLFPDHADGAMTADLPAGVHDLVLERKSPAGRWVGVLLLVIGFSALAVL
ncbi:MAG TPA: hypothetical protein PLU72_02215 [Candidatus Ozemobacteraceae bacterium]|nr:hypothetical protein [Candidatus Ozemobacteraceae bacterium]